MESQKVDLAKGETRMKCPKCGGNAELSNWGSYTDPDYADFHVECEKCGYHSMGSTDPQKAKEMFKKGMGKCYTNEEWLRQANTKELADVIFRICERATWDYNVKIMVGEKRKDLIVEWLKEIHNDNS